MTDSSADRDPLDRLAEEFVARYRAGQRPSLTEYAQRLPDRAEEIRDLFPALLEMEQLKPVTADHTGEYAGTAEPADPSRVGEFRILRRVGVGGMGVVYEAVQESLGRHVALKVLPAEALADPRRLERFRREAKAAARLHHTNIVPVFGTGQADGRHYYAMQFIAGHPLDAVIAEVRRLKGRAEPPAGNAVSEVAMALVTGTFTRPAEPAAPATPSPSGSAPALSGSLSDSGRAYWVTVARIGAGVADALAYAHGQGVLHRDIKPANLLLDLQGTVWVTDFGLAKSADADDLTHAGDIVGTLRYMAPERFDGTGDHRADVYSLGLTLYELLTLRPAFVADNRARLVQEVTAASPPRPRSLNPEVPRDLETVVLKATARDPAERYATAAALAEDLRRFAAGEPVSVRPAGLLERTYKWARRKPALAGLYAVAALAVVLVGFAGVVGSLWREAVHAHGQAESARDALREAQDRLVRVEYGRTVQVAHQEWRENNVPATLALLNSTRADLRGWEWRYVHRLCHTDLLTLKGHTADVGPAAFSPDGRRVVTGSHDWTAKVWDASSGAEVLTLKGHTAAVWSMSFSPDGSRVVTGSADRTAKVWDARSRAEARSSTPPPKGR